MLTFSTSCYLQKRQILPLGLACLNIKDPPSVDLPCLINKFPYYINCLVTDNDTSWHN
jgi:hypothetical protein